ncbi:MAG: hypothetical protein QF562_02045, partial [Verrucomicrobiota bacterium]|nr:hypothetical protein [Verrucomicrobiota bacterium]
MTQQIIAQSEPNGMFMLILFGIVGLVLLVGALIVLNFGMTWLRARVSGAPVKFIELIALQLR